MSMSLVRLSMMANYFEIKSIKVNNRDSKQLSSHCRKTIIIYLEHLKIFENLLFYFNLFNFIGGI